MQPKNDDIDVKKDDLSRALMVCKLCNVLTCQCEVFEAFPLIDMDGKKCF